MTAVVMTANRVWLAMRGPSSCHGNAPVARDVRRRRAGECTGSLRLRSPREFALGSDASYRERRILKPGSVDLPRDSITGVIRLAVQGKRGEPGNSNGQTDLTGVADRPGHIPFQIDRVKCARQSCPALSECDDRVGTDCPPPSACQIPRKAGHSSSRHGERVVA